MMKDPDVYRYILKQKPWSDGKTKALLQRQESLYRQEGYCLFAVEMKGSHVLAGYCGVQPLDDFSELMLGKVGISWVFSREFWGAGLATESAAAFLEYAFRNTGLKEIKALIHPANRGSVRVASKIGFEFDDLVFRNGKLRIMYSLLKENCLSTTPPVWGEVPEYLQPGLI